MNPQNKIKAGVWVRNRINTSDFSVVSEDTEKFYMALGRNFEDEWELWQPEEGEWVVFKGNPLYPNINFFTVVKWEQDFGIPLMECEPFTGNLPRFII